MFSEEVAERLTDEEIQLAKEDGERKLIGLEDSAQLSLKITKTVAFFKVFLALLVALSYFFFKDWLPELIVISVIVSLIAPHGFFSTYIVDHLEYNTEFIEVHRKIMRLETNKHFYRIDKEIEAIKCSSSDLI